MSKFFFNDLTAYDICIKVKFTKNPVGHKCLWDSHTCAYQGLYINFGFSGRCLCNKDGNIVESSYAGIEGIHGEVVWILVSDGIT